MAARKPAETTPPLTPLITIREAAEVLRVSIDTVRRLIRAGDLNAARVGLGRKKNHWRIDPDDIKRFVAMQAPTPRAKPRRREKLPEGFIEYV